MRVIVLWKSAAEDVSADFPRYGANVLARGAHLDYTFAVVEVESAARFRENMRRTPAGREAQLFIGNAEEVCREHF